MLGKGQQCPCFTLSVAPRLDGEPSDARASWCDGGSSARGSQTSATVAEPSTRHHGHMEEYEMSNCESCGRFVLACFASKQHPSFLHRVLEVWMICENDRQPSIHFPSSGSAQLGTMSGNRAACNYGHGIWEDFPQADGEVHISHFGKANIIWLRWTQ